MAGSADVQHGRPPGWTTAGLETTGTAAWNLISTIAIPTDSMWYLEILILGFESGGTGRACFRRNVFVTRAAGSISVETFDAPLSRRGGLATDARFVATGPSLSVNVKGITGQTWEWVCQYQSFGTEVV